MSRPVTSRAVAVAAGDGVRPVPPTLRRLKTPPRHRPTGRCRARMSPPPIWESVMATPSQARRRVGHIPPAIARTAGVVGAARRLVAWDLRCRRPIPVQRHRLRPVTALSRRAPLTAKRAPPPPRPTLVGARRVISGCRCAAGVGFPARRACSEERRMRPRQAAIRPRTMLRPARRARKANSRPAGGVDAHSRVSAKLCRPAKTDQATARGGMLLGRAVGNPTAVSARKDRATVNPSDLGSRSIAGEVVDRATETAAAPAVPNPLVATTGAPADEVRAAREMGSAGGDAMRRQGASSRSSIR